jgi:hypothetical protein
VSKLDQAKRLLAGMLSEGDQRVADVAANAKALGSAMTR